MLKFTLDKAEITEYPKFVDFLIANGLEFEEEDKEDENPGIVKMWKITQGLKDESDVLVGACVLCFREGIYILDGIAVDFPMRKFGLGKMMMDKAEKEAKAQGANELWLVARVPEFYKKLGYETVSMEGAPQFFSCYTCPQRGVDCFPEVMKKIL